jgi:hypothetical protein
MPPPSPGGEEQGVHNEDGQEELIVEKDMLPAGMAESSNPGDILEFKVVGKDAEGHLTVVYNTGDGETKESGGERMKADFRKEMAAESSGGGY